MEEKQLIRKIEQLKSIRPSKEWVVFTKENILKDSSSVMLKHRLFNPIQRPALVFAFRGVMVLVVIMAGAFFYMYYMNSSVPNITLFQSQETKRLNTSLKGIQDSLDEITVSLAKLKESRDSRESLVMAGVIKDTVGRGQDMVEKIKDQSESKKVYASLGEIEDTLGDLREVSYSMQKEMIENALNDLKQRTLDEEDQETLASAEEYYSQGKEGDAIILIMKILER